MDEETAGGNRELWGILYTKTRSMTLEFSGINIVPLLKTFIMIIENYNDSISPDDVLNTETPRDNNNIDDNEEEGYDILPSNGPGLADDDGEQTVDPSEVDEDLEEVDLDDDDEDDDE